MFIEEEFAGPDCKVGSVLIGKGKIWFSGDKEIRLW